MSDYFVITADGKDISFTIADEAEGLPTAGIFGEPAFTTYNPRNAARIVAVAAEERPVLACSDVLIEAYVATGDPEVIWPAFAEVGQRCPEHGGFRPLGPLDLAHYAMQADWQRPGFAWSAQYIQHLASGDWLTRYPLNPFADFLGVERVYAAAAIATWVDYRRFAVVPGQERYTDLLFHDYMGLDGPGDEPWARILADGPLAVLNDEHTHPSVARWLIAAGCWSGTDYRRHPVLGRCWQRCNAAARGDQYRTAVLMTRWCVNYLYVHHRWLLTGGETGFNPYAFFSSSKELADAYTRAFPAGAKVG